MSFHLTLVNNENPEDKWDLETDGICASVILKTGKAQVVTMLNCTEAELAEIIQSMRVHLSKICTEHPKEAISGLAQARGVLNGNKDTRNKPKS